jgi:enoyl-CoA hydratase/carnithine racemase
MSDNQAVLYEALGPHVALVTLNRPDKRNAVNGDIAAGVEAALRRSEADPEIRVVLLASSEPRVFCAGADLAAVSAGAGNLTETPDGGFAGFVYAQRRKPWIAVVEGMAVAGGFEICLACDLIVAAESARFGLPEVKRGLIAGAGGLHRLPSLLPLNLAREMVATGEPISAERAYAMGVVNRLAPAGEALAAARALADTIAANAPIAVQESLRLMDETRTAPDAEGRRMVAAAYTRLKQTEDYREGPRAFVEKRAPVWKGR